VLLPGLCAWTNSDPYCHGEINAAARAGATFRVLSQQLTAVHARYRAVYFSYDPRNPAGYTVDQTHQAVARSASALETQLRSVWTRDRNARFDLVGHSLGGVVAASWAVSDGRHYGYHASQGLLSRVNSIVTYDSPVRGLS